jgi:uncharacterized heparinase superfamily protein
MIQKSLQLFHTLRYLRWEQVVYRLHARLGRVKIRTHACPSLRPGFPGISTSACAEPSLVAPHTFCFLGESHQVDLQSWDISNCSDLWRYNLHYFDDLNARDFDARFDAHCELIKQWVQADLPLDHVAWAPYPTSLRIVNWIKWLVRYPDQTSATTLLSLARQADVLEQRIEYHLLGNHLFENARALVFAGAFFSGPEADRWLSTGLRILDRELQEQFLPDGGHFELSPMYQATMLRGVLDLIELSKNHAQTQLSSRSVAWATLFEEGLAWLDTMSFPDGEIAFFNDAAFGVAPTVAALRQRANLVTGLPHAKGECASVRQISVIDLRESGYVRVEWDGAVLIADMACIGPDYLPGHAHADTLSFELSLGRNRLFVNSGTSCYGTGAERLRQRGTAAHNTVEVDAENSSEVWSGFRVARRAYPEGRSVTRAGDIVTLTCGHNGYMRLPGKVRHSRKWMCTPRCLLVEDSLSGNFGSAASRLILHPAWKVSRIERQKISLIHNIEGQEVAVHIDGGDVRVEAYSWHPRFGDSIPTSCLVMDLKTPRLRCSVQW